MAEIIRMPRLSDTMEEGNIVKWLKNEGDPVAPGDILAEVETDKATMDLESFHTGFLLHIGIKEGPVPVDGIIAVIGDNGEDIEKLLAEAEKSNKKEETVVDSNHAAQADHSSSASKPKEAVQKIQISTTPQATKQAAESVAGDTKVKASPLAKKIASEKGIDLLAVQGTGNEGRIVKRDVENYVPLSPRTAVTMIAPKSVESNVEYGSQPVSQMRKVIARRLSESKFGAPHFYLTIAIDMEESMRARKAINEEEGVKVSYNDLVVKACAYALGKHPMINASWMGDTIEVHSTINIGVAVAVDEGLVVPVLHNTNTMNLMAINSLVKELAAKARSKKIQPKEMQGNTFTISNLGMFGIEEFTAIINPPDACILAVGGIQEKAMVKNGEVKVGHEMKVTLSCDHRIVDGVTGAKFLNTLKFVLENPVRMLV